MNEREHHRTDPREPYPYCDCGRIMRDGACKVCQAEPVCVTCGRWSSDLSCGECLPCRNLRLIRQTEIPVTEPEKP